MTEQALPDFRRRFKALPDRVRASLARIASSSLDESASPTEHESLLLASIKEVDKQFGEAVRIEMGWCLEQMDDVPIAQWVARQSE